MPDRLTVARLLDRAETVTPTCDPAAGTSQALCHQGGILSAWEEAARALGDDRYGRAVAGGLEALVAAVDDVQDSSLYFGLAGAPT